MAINRAGCLFGSDEPQLITHSFGGVWTREKLKVLEQYLKSFTLAFDNQNWARTIYIDAYAGSGQCDIKDSKGNSYTIAGSAQLALETVPTFDEVVFIESDIGRYNHLLRLQKEFPQLSINVHRGDCNQILPNVLKGLTRSNRGVIFVDPYGMNISWDTLQAIAMTRKLDVWYLFPLSGFYRQAARNYSQIDADKAAALVRLMGDENWKGALYQESPILDMFGAEGKTERVADVSHILKYVTSRLETLFPYVSRALVLPELGPPRFALYFAVSNDSPRAKDLAKRISNHILTLRG